MNFRKTIPGSPASQTQCEHHRVEKTPILTRYFSLQPGILFRSTWVTWCPWHIMISYYPNGFNNSRQMWKLKAVGLYDLNMILSSHIFIWQEPWFPPHLWYLWSLTMACWLDIWWHLYLSAPISSNSKGFLIFCSFAPRNMRKRIQSPCRRRHRSLCRWPQDSIT